MGTDSVIGGLIAVAILVYVMYTLRHPERF
jgi:hypothetical protein